MGDDADDREAFAVQVERLSDNSCVGAESALPQAMTHNDDSITAGLIFFRKERAAQLRLDAQQGKEVGRDTPTVDSFRLAHTRQVKALIGNCCHSFKDLVLITPVNVVSRCGRIAGNPNWCCPPRPQEPVRSL